MTANFKVMFSSGTAYNGFCTPFPLFFAREYYCPDESHIGTGQEQTAIEGRTFLPPQAQS
ncbi:hypothetical protein H5410_032064 [Solanum commersonii]|uniref:Uncharacterized protein n=1 Tax=Solanum commersonii TaxID=4109 RepID=A0A9J5YP85_SOLCO|nr:hypothetical protein H5410_032064 [Solanum commersonii]